MAKKHSDILMDDDYLRIFRTHSGVEVDKTLPKYSEVQKILDKEKKDKKDSKPANYIVNNVDRNESPFINLTTPDNSMEFQRTMMDYRGTDFSFLIDADTRTVNVFASKSGLRELFGTYNEPSLISLNGALGVTDGIEYKQPPKFIRVVKRVFKALKEETEKTEEYYEMDIIDFFNNVKGLTKDNVKLYVNRLVGYIIAMKNADLNGQTALKEKLLRDMIINKYESVLYANDLYYVVTEDQVVKFVKKTKNGVRLTYVKNYVRIIPPEVTKRIQEINKFEIFDNYVILHYDPDTKSYSETVEETKRRRDPILFGVIRGSNKLYYITDWVDEYCNLTLDKFVETLQIKKESLKMKESL